MMRVEIWIFTTLFALGVIGGMTYLNVTGVSIRNDKANHDFRATLVEDQDSNSIVDDSNLKNADPEYNNALLQTGDRYLVAGNYALALDRYFEFEKAIPRAGTATVLRQALCYELQQRYSRAEKEYHRVMTTAPNVHHQLLGIAGLCRCLMRMGKLRESLSVLADQTLKIDEYRGVPDEILAPLVYQFAEVLLINAAGVETNLLGPNDPAFEDALPKPELLLRVIDETKQEVRRSIESPTEISVKILQKPSNSANVITASVVADIEPVLMLVSRLTTESDLELLISERAAAAIQNRSKSVKLQSVQLSTLLDSLLGPFGLVWYQIDSELHVVMQDELDPAIAPKQFWFDSAQRALRRFEVRFPDDFRRNLALLSRANLSLIQNQLDSSANLYQELVQAQPGDEVLAKLFFNRAKLQLLLGKNVEANRLFYLAIDQTLEPRIESSSYCLLSSNLLSAGDLEMAIRTSRRGLATATCPEQKQTASLNLARAYLLNDDPFSANNVLFENRDSFNEESAKHLASLFGAYARFIGVKNKTGMLNARNRLFSAIAMTPDSDYASFADCYFAAHAFQELGFTENANDKYVLALSRPDVGTWQRRILYELALAKKGTGQTEEALSMFQTLVDRNDDSWNRLALHRIAEIFAESNQTAACIETCKKLWQSDLTDEEKKAALQVLGIAYQQQGEHYSAALCFAGILPDSL